jgi:hypothetical protein
VDEAREERLRIAVNFDASLPPCPRRLDIPAPDKAGLLFPPRIEMLWPDLFLRGDKMDGLIQVNTSDVFGIVHIYMTLRDEAGTLLESGLAMHDETCEGYWGYIPSVNLPAGTSVIVRAVAMDELGGMGIASEKVTVRGK